MKFYPSPGRDKIAIVGCYWANPYFVVIYDFQNPTQLPLKRIIEILLSGNDFEKWISAIVFVSEIKMAIFKPIKLLYKLPRPTKR